MTHAAVVSAGLSWFLVFLALLLVMFVYTVIRIPPQATGAHAHTACATGAPRPRATALRAGTAGQPGDAGYPARRAADPAPGQAVIHWPKVSGEPPWGPAPQPPGLGPLGS
jgi:hypothetical protein